MKAKHTPGPWYDMPDGSMIPLKSIYCERLGFTIGFVNTDRKSVEEQAQANARLICAAPDLLEDLRFAAATLRRYQALHAAKSTPGGSGKASANAALAERFEATIFKATGEKT